MNRIPTIFFAAACLLAVGCPDGLPRRITIGSKDFTEQQLLAEMMALTAEREGIRVDRAIPYGPSRKNLEGLRRGVIDAYPEYSGTLLALSGEPILTNPSESATRARSVVQQNDLEYLQPFGPDSRYAIAVRRDVALRYELNSISDLQDLPSTVRFAVDEGFHARPTDGLYAMARNYGLRVGEVIKFPPEQRDRVYEALLEGKADAAQVSDTDGRLNTHGVEILEDDRQFFGAYLAAPLVRRNWLESLPALKRAWDGLGQSLDSEALRRLNRRIGMGGEDYRDVARSHLMELGLLPEGETPSEPRDRVTLAVSPVSNQGGLAIRAAEAIRKVMPARNLLVEETPDPAAAVRRGTARFGLVGAESFFELDEAGNFFQVPGLEAVGVVGSRFAHLVAATNAPPPEEWSKLGVGARGGNTWQVARMMLAALELTDQIELIELVTVEEIATALENRAVDARLIMAPAGDVGLNQLLRSGRAQLISLNIFERGSPTLRYPFLRQAQIPADTYPGQTEAIPTVSGQTVLATRVPVDEVDFGKAGPGLVPGVITRRPRRLPFETAKSLHQALAAEERVDPTLPASPGLAPETPEPKPRLKAQPLSALLNLLAIVFLGAMVILLLQNVPKHPEMLPGTRPSD